MQTAVKRNCGHQTVEQLYGPGAERTRKAAWLATQPCRECRDKATAATVAAASADLPALTGSDKQIEWANKIRADLLADLTAVRTILDARAAKNPGPDADELLAVADKAIAAITAKAHARFWIDNRDAGATAVLKAEMARLSK